MRNPQPVAGFRIDVLGDVLRLEVDGVVAERRSMDAVASAVEAARKNGCPCILFDIRKANHPDYHASVVRRADAAVATGITKFRIAILGTSGSPLLAFIENVAMNRGLPARCFTEESAAMRWLRANPVDHPPEGK